MRHPCRLKNDGGQRATRLAGHQEQRVKGTPYPWASPSPMLLASVRGWPFVNYFSPFFTSFLFRLL